MISHGNIVSSLMQKVISKAEDAKIIDVSSHLLSYDNTI